MTAPLSLGPGSSLCVSLMRDPVPWQRPGVSASTPRSGPPRTGVCMCVHVSVCQCECDKKLRPTYMVRAGEHNDREASLVSARQGRGRAESVRGSVQWEGVGMGAKGPQVRSAMNTEGGEMLGPSPPRGHAHTPAKFMLLPRLNLQRVL